MESLGELLVFAFGAISLWGWGSLARALAKLEPAPVAQEIAIGLAAVIFVGGVLNALHLAYALALDALAIIGLAAAAVGARTRFRAGFRASPTDLIVTLPVIAAAIFLARFVTPPGAFNWHDDLERYFSYPVRMLATGTLGGNTLGCLGADSLGAQALLHGFAVAHFELSHLGSVDAVFGFLLCLILAGFGLRSPRAISSALAAQVVLAAIHPVIVNVSSTFTTIALILGLGFFCHDANRTKGRWIIIVGLFYAALLALKSTNAIFVAFHAIALAITSGGPAEKFRPFRFALAIAGSTAGFLIPWLATHATVFAAAIGNEREMPELEGTPEPVQLFGAELSGYGASQYSYTVTALAAMALAVGAWLATRRATNAAERSGSAMFTAGFAGALSYGCLVVWLAPFAFSQVTAYRYAAPWLIGAAALVSAHAGAVAEERRFRIVRFASAAFAIAVVLLFAPTFSRRIEIMMKFGAPLAYLSTGTSVTRYAKGHAGYVHDVMQPSQRERLRAIQQLVPAGEPIVVWVMTPFWLDFARNPIFNTDPNGVAMPWSRLPEARYFIWEFTGVAVRRELYYRRMMMDSGASERKAGYFGLSFIAELQQKAKAGEVLFSDGKIALWRVGPK